MHAHLESLDDLSIKQEECQALPNERTEAWFCNKSDSDVHPVHATHRRHVETRCTRIIDTHMEDFFKVHKPPLLIQLGGAGVILIFKYSSLACDGTLPILDSLRSDSHRASLQLDLTTMWSFGDLPIEIILEFIEFVSVSNKRTYRPPLIWTWLVHHKCSKRPHQQRYSLWITPRLKRSQCPCHPCPIFRTPPWLWRYKSRHRTRLHALSKDYHCACHTLDPCLWQHEKAVLSHSEIVFGPERWKDRGCWDEEGCYWEYFWRHLGIENPSNCLASLIHYRAPHLPYQQANLLILRYAYVVGYDPEPLAREIFRALATLPSFQGFDRLDILGALPSSFPLQLLSNLTILKVFWFFEKPVYLLPKVASLFARCPNLSEVSLKSGEASSDARFNLICTELSRVEIPSRIKRLETHGVVVTSNDIRSIVQHLRHLEFLGITNNRTKDDASTALGSICDTLRQHAIYLKGISVDVIPDPLFLSYLTSFSGLVDLKIFVMLPPEEDCSRIISDQIYREILPKHRETLEILQLRSLMPGALWSTIPTDDQLSGLLRCQQLKKLEVSHGMKPGQLQWNGTNIFVCLAPLLCQISYVMCLLFRMSGSKLGYNS